MFLGLIFYAHGNRDPKEQRSQWFGRGEGGILIVIPPLSLGCRDPVINVISGHVMQKIFHFTDSREGI